MEPTNVNENNPALPIEMTVEQWLDHEDISVSIWRKKYQNGDETFEQWLDRVSGGNQCVRQLISEKKFIFAGRILANRGIAGRKYSLANCYCCAPPQDNLESIFETGAKLARTFSYGGGSGIDVSKLRPEGAIVHNAAKTTSGAVSFMDFYSYVAGLIAQNGRRGALILTISCDHPDVIDFINLKTDLNICTKANISVRVTDEFMRAVENNEDFQLDFELEDGSHIGRAVKAKEVFMLLAQRNWEMAEPGILYWDRISNYNLMQGTGFRYAGTNPCGEQPLPAWGACLLGSINLSEFVNNPFSGSASVDMYALKNTVEVAVRALNDVLNEGLPLHPLQEQRDSVGDWRQIGLGTLGLADMLIKLRIRYGSPESLNVIECVYHQIAKTAITTSLNLAKEKGCFRKCTQEVRNAMAASDFMRNLNMPLHILDDIRRYGLYNSQLLTCAPTGTIGTMLQTSTGVEPIYALKFKRRTVSLNDKETVYDQATKIIAKLLRATGNTALPDYVVTAPEINYKDRIAVQSALQKYIDASISSTVNLPNSATVEDVADLYMKAWKEGLKGITIWRDGCQRQAILSAVEKGDEKKTIQKEESPVYPVKVRKVSDDCIGRKRSLVTGCGTLHLLAYFDRETGQLLETYFTKGSQGGCANFMVGLSRMVSLAARAGVSIEEIVDQLKSSGTCPSYAIRKATQGDTSKGSCCPVAIGYALLEMYREIQEEVKNKKFGSWNKCYNQEMEEESFSGLKCPKCGETLNMTEGCMTCSSCGYSKCS